MRIFVFGSLNVDKVYKVKAFVREGETINSLSYQEFPGGKGLNQTIAAARAGVDVLHIGAIGSDGKLLSDTLLHEGVPLTHLHRLPCATGHAVIQVNSQGQNAIIVDQGANAVIQEEWVDEALLSAQPGDLVLLQNEINNVPYIIRRAREAGLSVAFNPSPITDTINDYPLSLVTHFILNEIEGEALTGETEDAAILDGLARRFPNAEIMLTLGSRGAMYSGASGRAAFGAYPVEAVDTTAAGDTFCGYYFACIARGMDAHKAMLYATGASAISVTREGASTSIPRFEEVNAFIAAQGDIRKH
jgi:ribokinase